MRIIGGSLKGKIILPPPEFKARPTTDVAKEALFNILDNEFEFEGLNVLDLFSGTGSISYEFASRGVGHVWSVEMNQQYSSFIKDQAKKLGLKNCSSPQRVRFHSHLQREIRHSICRSPIRIGRAGDDSGQSSERRTCLPGQIPHSGARRRTLIRRPSGLRKGKTLRPSTLQFLRADYA